MLEMWSLGGPPQLHTALAAWEGDPSDCTRAETLLQRYLLECWGLFPSGDPRDNVKGEIQHFSSDGCETENSESPIRGPGGSGRADTSWLCLIFRGSEAQKVQHDGEANVSFGGQSPFPGVALA